MINKYSVEYENDMGRGIYGENVNDEVDPVKNIDFPRGGGTRGEGATQYPNIYNIFFLVTLGSYIYLVTGKCHI